MTAALSSVLTVVNTMTNLSDYALPAAHQYARLRLARLPTLMIIGALLAGCAGIPHKPLVEGVTSASPTQAMPGTANGSIFQTGQAMNYGYQPLFEDRRPRNIGDTLTILLQENVSASKSSSANASKGGSVGLGFDAMPRFMNGLFSGDRANTAIEGSNDFNGKGGAAAKNTFSGTITVTVKQVLENGNLLVIGEKQIAINQGTEFIRFSGVVNPRTISGSNTVISTQVADARIEYVGSGYINEAQQMGWLQRLFLNLSPF
jgi:flagellar L-ring protein precursor FlgH